MSYYLGMGFVSVKDKTEAFEKANLFSKICMENYKEVLDMERNYIPSIRLSKRYEPANEYWLFSVFTYNFVYWEKYNLLGIKGVNYPEKARELFDVYVEFQNSTDQDYDFKEWGTTIPLFNEIVEKFKALSDEKIKEYAMKKYGSDDEEIDIEYQRRSAVYDEICDAIELFEFLYDKEGTFERFSMSSLQTQHQRMEANRYVRYLVLKEEEELEALFGKKEE